MRNPPVKESAYADVIYHAVDVLCERERGGFTLTELSEYTNLPVTHNMRKRLNHCVHAGTLLVKPIMKQARGSCYFYYKPSIQFGIQEELPL